MLSPAAFAASPGLRYMALGAFWFSVMSLLVKAVGARLPSMEVVLARAVVTLALSALMLRQARVRPWGAQPRRLLLRGLLGFGGLTCFYYGLTHLPIADATVLQYTNPVFTALLAALFLGEHLSRRELVATLASFAGVVLVARPSALAGAAALPTLPLLVALLGALLSASAYVAVRAMGTSEHPLVVVFYLPLVSVPLALPTVIPSGCGPRRSSGSASWPWARRRRWRRST
jgi:drug/metabolite transporter (DMT)-like permease